MGGSVWGEGEWSKREWEDGGGRETGKEGEGGRRERGWGAFIM